MKTFEITFESIDITFFTFQSYDQMDDEELEIQMITEKLIRDMAELDKRLSKALQDDDEDRRRCNLMPAIQQNGLHLL